MARQQPPYQSLEEHRNLVCTSLISTMWSAATWPWAPAPPEPCVQVNEDESLY